MIARHMTLEKRKKISAKCVHILRLSFLRFFYNEKRTNKRREAAKEILLGAVNRKTNCLLGGGCLCKRKPRLIDHE